MKTTYKLAAAISFALFAGNAAAAIDTGFGFATGDAKPGSLVFSAVDDATKQTFILNLGLATTSGVSGLNYADFAGNKPGAAGFSTVLSDALTANGGKLVWNLSSYSQFGSFISNVANLRWSVLAGYEKDNVAGSNYDKLGVEPGFDGLYTDTYNTQWGALVTAPGVGSLNPNGNAELETNPSETGTTGAYLAAVNAKIAAEGEDADVASLDPVNGVAFYDTKVDGWQGALLSGVPTKNGAGEYDFIWATNPFADGKNQFASLGKFVLGTDNTLTFSTQVAAVPVPGAVWLFGSALAGLLGVSRRKAGGLAV
ncbi:hypothetical protein [Methylomonas koyamae]|uniref:Uncharacterized protein n=1 Tax=Methylomonas koyamae TaxID=702114 RepID=A0A291IJ37_9GAMM|nr:hypothetical protein [Methylomonas koyamae]ATG90289.1 hypothetical protein MKLM6_2060 [Methylomonas koyamae]OAI25304.1 hypothetical protein A1356_13630 [Methylomonas koyamae]